MKQALQKMMEKSESDSKNEFEKIEYMIKTTWGTGDSKRLVDRKKALQMFKHDYDFIKLCAQKGFDKVSGIAILKELESPEVMRDLICIMEGIK